MKRQAFNLVGLLTLLLVAGSAIAQSNRVVANVPFAFTVANNSLPAGTYSVEALSARDNRSLLLRGADGSSGMIISSIAAQGHKPAAKTKLVFNRYGDQYFLSQIWVEGATLGREMAKTSREKEVAKAMAQRPKPAQVEIVASLN